MLCVVKIIPAIEIGICMYKILVKSEPMLVKPPCPGTEAIHITNGS